jgi:hypothetical protein
MRFQNTPLQSLRRSRSLSGLKCLLPCEGQRYTAFIAPAQITDTQTGQERLLFPGGREELVERALRFIAVQQIAKTKLTPDTQGSHAVTVFFTLSMIRRHLEELGHGYKLSEIKEALDILSDTSIEVRLDSDVESAQSKRRRFMKGTILSNYGDIPTKVRKSPRNHRP